MAIYVIDPVEKASVPFLRGILTRSLQNAGLPFNHAYEIADKVRNQLGHHAEISTRELTARVVDALEKGDSNKNLSQESAN